jgi:hypothetical protein
VQLARHKPTGMLMALKVWRVPARTATRARSFTFAGRWKSRA